MLTWELKDTDKLDKAQAILESLQQKDLPCYRMRNLYWQGNYAAYFLAHIFEVSNAICLSLQEKILDNDYRCNLCKYLADLGNFNEAIDITLKLSLISYVLAHWAYLSTAIASTNLPDWGQAAEIAAPFYISTLSTVISFTRH